MRTGKFDVKSAIPCVWSVRRFSPRENCIILKMVFSFLLAVSTQWKLKKCRYIFVSSIIFDVCLLTYENRSVIFKKVNDNMCQCSKILMLIYLCEWNSKLRAKGLYYIFIAILLIFISNENRLICIFV